VFVPLISTPGYEDSRPADADVMAMKCQDERQARQERLADQREAEDWLPVTAVSMPRSRSYELDAPGVPAGGIPSARARGPPDGRFPVPFCHC
jgi:hypothetical protein